VSGRSAPRKDAPARQRADKWLWFARATKTRALAAKLVSAGHVRLNGKRMDDPGRGLLVGDVLTIALARDVRVLKIVGFGERRGPAAQARLLYEDMTPPRAQVSDASDCGADDLAERDGSG
jgi:ribosome-associated heat shock protein Hsp15